VDVPFLLCLLVVQPSGYCVDLYWFMLDVSVEQASSSLQPLSTVTWVYGHETVPSFQSSTIYVGMQAWLARFCFIERWDWLGDMKLE
jgi:hypothetical protein